jgi:UDP-N-acetylglucosamine 2-epimerase (non-hydrolysing)/GDP/UDP-N,N'-diacetylbacillosamine 2-epimerase (hydrolysing)
VTRKKIAIITGSRSEFGILYWVIKEIEKSKLLDCSLIVTGSHLAASHGMTINEIEAAGFNITSKVPMLLDGDSPEYNGYSMGVAIMGLTKEIEKINPDIVLLLGDRFEIFAAATASMIMQIPIAHIAGGETDIANCPDGNIRNAITKLAHIHFVSTELYADRIRSMGEEEKRIFNVGLPSLDHIKDDLMSREELESSLQIKFKDKIMVGTYLPVVLRENESIIELKAIMESLKEFNDITIIFTLANADAGGRKINNIIKEYEKENDNLFVFQSLGKRRYLSLLNQAKAVIGNSSSGIIEAASFKLPVINVGVRQDGRIHQPNIINVKGNEIEIRNAINKALWDLDFRNQLKDIVNVFGDGTSSKKIVKVLENVELTQEFLEKRLMKREIV